VDRKKTLPNSWNNLWALPATTVMVGCIGKTARANIITIGGCGIMCAQPPLIGLALGTTRYSLGLITETRDFSVNVPSSSMARITDWCGRVSGKDVDKFVEGKLTPISSTHIATPYIGECPVSYECTLWDVIHCGSHDLVLGEVQCVHVDSRALNAGGDALDPSKFDPLTSIQLEYRGLGVNVGEWGMSVKE
jgi:flavin reductase (DIM6/NTAB) family NADH-FMN oxidoreductase RutF